MPWRCVGRPMAMPVPFAEVRAEIAAQVASLPLQLPAAVVGPELALRTFCHIQGIGRATERRTWRRGIPDWDSFISAPVIDGMGAQRKTEVDTQLRRLHGSLRSGEVRTKRPV